MSQVLVNFARIALSSWLGVQFLAPPSVVYAADLETIRERGYLVVAVKDNIRPLGFRDSQDQLQGLEIDIAHRLAGMILGNPNAVRFVPVANRDRLQLVMDDEVDLAIAQITATIARARMVYFSDPYYLNGTSLITKSPTGGTALIESTTQLTGKSIAVLNNSTTIATLKFHLPTARLVGVDSYAAAQAKLKAGEVAAFAGSTAVLTGWAQVQPEYQLLPTQFDRQPLAVAYPKGLQYADLGKVVSHSLRTWQTDGWLEQRATYWGLPWDRLRK